MTTLRKAGVRAPTGGGPIMEVNVRRVASSLLFALFASPSLARIAGKVCENTCATANNGVCEDLDHGSCAFGSDCGDCGGEKHYCCETEITVCNDMSNATSDEALMSMVNHRLGNINESVTDPSIEPRHACVPITCTNYPGCGGCEDMPACLPMSGTDRACSLAACEVDDNFGHTENGIVSPNYTDSRFLFSFSRSVGDGNVALVPDWWYTADPSTCVLLEGNEQPWDEREPKVVFRGDTTSGDYNRFQKANNVTNKVMRKDFVAKVAGNGLFDVVHAGGGRGSGASGHMDNTEQLAHKCLLYLEGNDVGSSAYWIFGTGSLVLAPEILTSQSIWDIKPWVHYVPFKNDLSDVNEVAQKYCGADVTGVDNGGNTSLSELRALRLYSQKRSAGRVLSASAREQRASAGAGASALLPERLPKREASAVHLEEAPSDDVAADISTIVQTARAYHAEMCDYRKEAVRMYAVLRRYADVTSSGSRAASRR